MGRSVRCAASRHVRVRYCSHFLPKAWEGPSKAVAKQSCASDPACSFCSKGRRSIPTQTCCCSRISCLICAERRDKIDLSSLARLIVLTATEGGENSIHFRHYGVLLERSSTHLPQYVSNWIDLSRPSHGSYHPSSQICFCGGSPRPRSLEGAHQSRQQLTDKCGGNEINGRPKINFCSFGRNTTKS